MDGLNDLKFTSAVTAMANLVADQLTDEELALVAAVLAQTADTLATIAVIRASRKEKDNNDL